MNRRDLLYPLLASLCYSTNPIMVKMGLGISNEPLLGACIGMTASTVVYSLYFFLTGQIRDLVTVPRWVGWYFAWAGVHSALGMFSFFTALEYAPAAIVAPLVATAPLVTLVLSRLMLRGMERITLADTAGTLLIVGGVVLLVS